MNEKLAQYRERGTQYWNQFSKKQKWLLLGTLVFLVATIGVITY
ncbi:hypothetical protein [Paenibacillus aquistagni]|nr:hypothetical protein [Paenibacillus aquistagni]